MNSKVLCTIYTLQTHFRNLCFDTKNKCKKSRRGLKMKRNRVCPPAKEREEPKTKQQNKVKPDAILKTFWRNNERFADLFNAVLFDGQQVIEAEALTESDTDLSSLLKMNGHAETIQKVFDVVKKTAYGVDFVIWGLENQDNVHYAMPLRHMLNDSLVYLKECNEIIAENRREKQLKSSSEFLSGLKKADRLHPIISICVYYGEEDWDGPLSLTDMLNIPEKLKLMVADYKMNLLQVKRSENFPFHNQDIKTVFEVIRLIYGHEYEKINTVYMDKPLDTELALVIGSITKSQRIIDQALDLEQEGKQMQMCKALQELEQRGMETGFTEGIESGKKELLRQKVAKKLAKGKQLEVIADELEEDIATIQTIVDEIQAAE